MSKGLKVFSNETKLPGKTHILRVKKYNRINFTKEQIPRKPPSDLFDLSSKDKEDGLKRGKQPTLSVWQSTIPKGHLLENTNITKEDLPGIYKLNVGDIHAIQIPVGMIPVEVYSDPVSDRNTLSSHLHAGIQGLYRPKMGTPKKFYKNMKDELVQMSALEY